MSTLLSRLTGKQTHYCCNQGNNEADQVAQLDFGQELVCYPLWPGLVLAYIVEGVCDEDQGMRVKPN